MMCQNGSFAPLNLALFRVFWPLSTLSIFEYLCGESRMILVTKCLRRENLCA